MVASARTPVAGAQLIGKESFRRELKTVLDPLISGGQIEEVLFQEFVVQ